MKPTVDEFLHAIEQTNRAGAQFLKLDLQTANIFVQIARQTSNDVHRRHNCKAARRAYDTVVKLASRIDLNDVDAGEITKSLTKLRSQLRGLGETL